MASETDGDFVRNANRLGPELKTVADRTSLVYLLVYEPKSLTKPGAFHKLKVEVKAPAARVLARSGYYEPRPYASLSPLERLLASGDLVTGGARGEGIDGHLIAAAFASPGETAQVPVVLEIPGASLLLGDEGAKTGVQIYAYANDADGTLADYVATEMTLGSRQDPAEPRVGRPQVLRDPVPPAGRLRRAGSRARYATRRRGGRGCSRPA